MFVEFFGFPASGKSSAAELLKMELGNLQQTTLLFSHGRFVAGERNSKSRESQISINNRYSHQVLKKLNLFFIIFFAILKGPVDPINKLRFIKRLLVLFTALKKSKDKIIICDEGFLQLYISAQMPAKYPLDVVAIKEDLDVIFRVISHVVLVSCEEEVIKKRLSERVLDHSRSKKWGDELTSKCLREFEQTIALVTQTYPDQLISIAQEKNLPDDVIHHILSANK